MKITSFRILNYRGVALIDSRGIFPQGVPAAGFVIKGPNSEGKTSVLEAFRAATAGVGISPDAIRIGADRSELFVNLDDVSVKRVITAKGSRLSIDGADAAGIRAPADWLATMLGAAPFDPIDLFRKKPKERRSAILGAIPLKVTAEELAAWLGPWALSAPPDLSLHALEVIEGARKDFYARRGAANARAKETQKEIDAMIAGAPPAVPGALSTAEAREAHASAGRHHGELVGRKQRVAEHASRTQRARGRVEELRLAARNIRAIPAPEDRREEIAVRTRDTYAEISRIEAEIKRLSDLAQKEKTMTFRLADERDAEAAVHSAHAKELALAKANEEQAAELEATLADTSEVEPSPVEIEEAEAATNAAARRVTDAQAAELRADHETRLAATHSKLATIQNEAGALDTMVSKFSKEIPASLLARADGVAGLSLEGDRIFLDGVDLDSLSGREQLLFAVEIHRRLSARAKILIVDGLERVDSDTMPEFLRKATAGGFQLIGTRVESGDVVFDAIEPDAEE